MEFASASNFFLEHWRAHAMLQSFEALLCQLADTSEVEQFSLFLWNFVIFANFSELIENGLSIECICICSVLGYDNF